MEIKLYRLSTCHWCDLVEDFLKEHSFLYESIVIDNLDCDEQERIISEVYKITGQRSFPVTVLDGSPVIGFDEKKLRRFLNLPPREGPRRAASKAVKEIFTADQREALRKWAAGIAEEFGCRLNTKEEDLTKILEGIIKNEKRYGYRSCPCRFAAGDYNKDADIICPCAYAIWDLEVYGRCYCALFVTDGYISEDPLLPEYLIDTRGIPREDLGKEIPREKAIPNPLRSYIKIIGYYFTKDIDREKLKEGFSEIAKSLDIDTKEIRWREGMGVAGGKNSKGENILIRMEQATDLYTYEIWLPEERDFPFPKNPMLDASIFIYSARPGDEVIKLHLKEKEEFGSLLEDGIKIYASFEHLRGKRDNFVFVADPLKISEEDIEKVVREVIKLENCYYLLRDQRQKYILTSDRINQIESSIVGKIGTINLTLPKATPENLKEWLHSLSTILSDVSSVLEEVRHYSSDTLSRIDVINNILKAWKETPLESLPTLGSFYSPSTLNIGDDYQRISSRIDGMRDEMMDVITILRTKVELITQDQSLELEKSMDETAKTHLKLQRTVEGLSVFVIAYYIVGLAKYIFEGAKTAGLIHISSTILSALFVPVAIIISFFLVSETKEWWLKRKWFKKNKKE